MINKEKRRAPSPPFSSPPPPPPPSQPQKPAALNIEQISPFPLLPPPPPPPEFPPTLQTTEGSGGNLAHDPPLPLPPPPPPPSSVLPVLKEGGDGVLGPEFSRGVKVRKKEKQSCELYIDAPRQSLLKQIQQGVKLKPVSCC